LRKAASVTVVIVNSLLAVMLGIMFIIVFLNVIFRYGFNTGLTWSEELTRYVFVWLIFIGSIVALKDDNHLKVTMVVEKLPAKLQKITAVVVELLLLYLVWLIFDGGLKMTQLNTANISPALGIPMSLLYVSSVVAAVGMVLVVLLRLYRIFAPRELTSEEAAAVANPAEARQEADV